MSANNQIILSCTGLGKRFTQGQDSLTVLENINFTVSKGERVAIVGVSGSGKSTLLHLLGGLDTPTSGSVTLQGQELNSLSESARGDLRNRSLGFVYQFHHLLPDFDALENVILPQLISDAMPDVAHDRATYLLTQLGLAERVHHRPAKLSGGEQQRVAVARALANRPKLVLADEPTGNLDEHTANIVLGEFMALVREEGSSAIVATHNERLAAKMDRIVRLHDGKLG